MYYVGNEFLIILFENYIFILLKCRYFYDQFLSFCENLKCDNLRKQCYDKCWAIKGPMNHF